MIKSRRIERMRQLGLFLLSLLGLVYLSGCHPKIYGDSPVELVNEEKSKSTSVSQVEPTVESVAGPVNAQNLKWENGQTVSNSSSIFANWTVSNSEDLSNQKVTFYQSSDCEIGTELGPTEDLGSVETSRYLFDAGVDGKDFTFKITSINAKGGINSTCSPSVHLDFTGPTVSVEQSSRQSDPASSVPIEFLVTFSEPILATTFSAQDITQGGSVTASSWTVTDTGDHQSFYLTALGVSGVGTVIPSIKARSVTDEAGNLNAAKSSSFDNSVSYDNVRPSVTIEQKTGQADPAPSLPVQFTVVFSKTMNSSTFTSSDITQGGSATVSAWTISDSGDHRTFTLTATTVTNAGTIIPSVDAGVASDVAGNFNTASTSSDNSVTFDNVSPTVTIEQKAGQSDPATSLPVNFTVSFSEPISSGTFVTSDITQNGTANVTAWTITDSGDHQTFTLGASVIIGSGTVVPSLAANRVADPSGNVNTASTSTDNSVTFNEPTVTVNFETNNSILVEGSATSGQTLNVTLSGAKPYDVNVGYSLVSAFTTTSSHNFTNGTLTIPAGQTTGSISYDFYGDAAATAGQSRFMQFALDSVSSSGLTIGSTHIHRRMITDDDGGYAPYTVISPGDYYTCAITSDHVLKCWGNGFNSGTLSDPAEIQDAGVSYEKVSVGSNAICGITVAGVLKCRGDIFSSGTGGSASTLTVVDSGTTYSQVSLRETYGCALTTGGVLKCWGRNTSGRLGDGTTTDHYTPMVVDSGVTYSFIEAGYQHACGITTAGVLKCWGSNGTGQVGNNSTTSVSSPVVVDSGVLYSKVSPGYAHTCAITTAGVLKCWGYNNSDQIGNGDIYSRATCLTPVTIDSGVTYVDVASGLGTSGNCAVTTSNVLKCWGDSAYGMTASSSHYYVPTQVDSGTSFSSVEAGAKHMCGITTNSGTKCWGYDYYGQLGVGYSEKLSTPLAVDAGVTYSVISAGDNHSCGITSAGILKCWGYSNKSQIGNGTYSGTYFAPITIDNGVTYSFVAAGETHTCAITTAGILKCWGSLLYGRLGNGTSSSGTSTTPITIDSGVTYSQVSLHTSHTCGITTSGVLKCWGLNTNGQLGNASTTQSATPVVIDAGVSYNQVSAGLNHTCGITSSGVLKCWGSSSSGQLGDGTNVQKTSPTVIDSGTSYSWISAGASYTCGVTVGKVLKCWGENYYRTLGNGTNVDSNSPVVINSGVDYSMVIAKTSHTCGITFSGELRCWGTNGYGQLGIGTISSVSGIAVVNSGTIYSKVSVGGSHTCSIKSNGALECAGDNLYGALGIGQLQTYGPVPIH